MLKNNVKLNDKTQDLVHEIKGHQDFGGKTI